MNTMKALEKNDSIVEYLFTLDGEIYSKQYRDCARAMLERGRALANTRLKASESAHAGASLLADIVYRFIGIAFSQGGAADEFSLTSVLNSRRASCLGISLVYVALAEFLDLPVHGVLYDQHIALKYSTGSKSFDIEPRFGGKILDRIEAQKHYGSTFPPPYGSPLSKGQLQAVVLANRAPVALSRLGAEKALGDLESAINIFPDYATAWINKAVIMFETGEATRAEGILERARELSPGPKTTSLIDTIRERYISS